MAAQPRVGSLLRPVSVLTTKPMGLPTGSTTRPSTPAGARTPGGLALRLFATCWLVYVLHFATNSVREIFPALTLGDRLSFDVSEYLGLHPDLFELPGRGAFIDNNPGASILGAIPYAIGRPITDRIVERVAQARAVQGLPTTEYGSPYPMAREFYRAAVERGLDVKLALGAAVMQAFLMAPTSALSVVVMFRILARLITSVRAAVLLSLLYGFATPVLYRTAQLNHNLLVGHVAFFAFALLWWPRGAADRWARSRYLLAGLLSGWAVVLDYTGLVVLGVIGAYAVACRAALAADARSRWDLPAFAAGAAASLSVLAGYQWLAFGSPLTPAQRVMPATLFSHYGYNGMDWPQPDLLWETLFGLRFGLFAFAPLLLLALYPGGWRRPFRLVGRRELWCIAAMTVLSFLFAAASQYGRLQFNSGVRYVVPVVPFLFLVVAGVLVRMPRPLAAVVGIVGTYWSWCLAMYRDVEQGAGTLEALIHVTTEGPRLPWLTTLERMGYASHEWTVPVLAVAGLLICGIWLWGTNSPRPLAAQANAAMPSVSPARW